MLCKQAVLLLKYILRGGVEVQKLSDKTKQTYVGYNNHTVHTGFCQKAFVKHHLHNRGQVKKSGNRIQDFMIRGVRNRNEICIKVMALSVKNHFTSSISRIIVPR